MLIKSKYIIQSFAVSSNYPSIRRCLKPHNFEHIFGSWLELFLFQIMHYLRTNPSNLLGLLDLPENRSNVINPLMLRSSIVFPNISYESRRQIETFRQFA